MCIWCTVAFDCVPGVDMRWAVVQMSALYGCAVYGTLHTLYIAMYKDGQVAGEKWVRSVLADRNRPAMQALARSPTIAKWRKVVRTMKAIQAQDLLVEGVLASDVLKANPGFAEAVHWQVPTCWLTWAPTGERCLDRDRGLLQRLQPFVPEEFVRATKRWEVEDEEGRDRGAVMCKAWPALDDLIESRKTYDWARTPRPWRSELPWPLKGVFADGACSAMKTPKASSSLAEDEDLAWVAAHCPSVRYYLRVADDAAANNARVPEFEELFVPAGQ